MNRRIENDLRLYQYTYHSFRFSSQWPLALFFFFSIFHLFSSSLHVKPLAWWWNKNTDVFLCRRNCFIVDVFGAMCLHFDTVQSSSLLFFAEYSKPSANRCYCWSGTQLWLCGLLSLQMPYDMIRLLISCFLVNLSAWIDVLVCHSRCPNWMCTIIQWLIISIQPFNWMVNARFIFRSFHSPDTKHCLHWWSNAFLLTICRFPSWCTLYDSHSYRPLDCSHHVAYCFGARYFLCVQFFQFTFESTRIGERKDLCAMATI